MRPDELRDQSATRAEPLPEERAVQVGEEDELARATEILRESEERVAEAAGGDASADAAWEHRRSQDTVDP